MGRSKPVAWRRSGHRKGCVLATQPATTPSTERNGVGHLLMYYAQFDDWRGTDVAQTTAAPTWAEGVRRCGRRLSPGAADHAADGQPDTHAGASLSQTFEPERARALLDKLEFVYTPKHGELAEHAECGVQRCCARQCLDRRIADIDTLRNEVSAWTEARNGRASQWQWRFTTADARIKLRHLYPKVRD